MTATEKATPNKGGRPPLGEEYEGIKPLTMRLPRPLLEALDLWAQYNCMSRADGARIMLWDGIRRTASTDRRFADLLRNNAIDVAPVNLKPKRDIYTDDFDPSSLV